MLEEEEAAGFSGEGLRSVLILLGFSGNLGDISSDIPIVNHCRSMSFMIFESQGAQCEAEMKTISMVE